MNNTKDNNSPVLSVCIPVYNKERDIRRCFDSLKNQTLKNIEFVIVDDGSTDNSGRICDEYAESDSRFKVIHQENRGVGATRQTAMDHAAGKYIINCDADDWVEPDAYETAVNKALETDADMVIFGYYRDEIQTGESKPIVFSSEASDPLDILYHLIKVVNNAVWNKMFRLSIIRENQITYQEGINSGEDFLLIAQIFLTGINKIEIIEKPLYHYCCDSQGNSLTHHYTLKTIKNQLEVRKWSEENLNFGIFKKTFEESLIGMIAILLKSKEYDHEIFTSFTREYLTWKLLFSTKLNLRWGLALGTKLIGIKNMYRLTKRFR